MLHEVSATSVPLAAGHHRLVIQMPSLAEWDVGVVLAEVFRVSFRVLQRCKQSPVRVADLADH